MATLTRQQRHQHHPVLHSSFGVLCSWLLSNGRFSYGDLPDEDAAHKKGRWAGRGRKGDAPMGVSRTIAPLINVVGGARNWRDDATKANDNKK